MVANIRSGSSPGGALRYNKEKVDKDEAEVLLWQKMLEPFDKHGRLDVDVCMESFWPYLEANRRTTNTVFHASLNPSPEDRQTDDQLRDIAQEYMERMGYGNQPYIVFKHKDISREHLHTVSLRVDEKGCKLPHDFEARRSAEITRDLEHKYNLHPAVKGQEQRDTPDLRKVNYKTGNVKQQISSVVRSCLRNYKCSSYSEFRTLLELFNVSVEERTGIVDGRNYAGVIYGALTDDGYGTGTPIKSSKIGKDVGYKALQTYYAKSKERLKEPGALDHLRHTVKDAMSPHNTRDEFRQLLKTEGIDTIFRNTNNEAARQILSQELSTRCWIWPMRGLSRNSKESSDGDGGSVGYDGMLFFLHGGCTLLTVCPPCLFMFPKSGGVYIPEPGLTCLRRGVRFRISGLSDCSLFVFGLVFV